MVDDGSEAATAAADDDVDDDDNHDEAMRVNNIAGDNADHGSQLPPTSYQRVSTVNN